MCGGMVFKLTERCSVIWKVNLSLAEYFRKLECMEKT